MSHTLLEVVQSIASSLNSDQVNSIGDTPEGLQIAECVKTSYLNMLGRYDLPEHNQFINLSDPVNPQNTPTVLLKPQGVNRIEWIKYYDSNVLDSASTQTSQFGAYSHDLNVDIVTTFPFVTTSNTCVAIAIGLANFTVASNTLPIQVGQGVQIFATPQNFMNGVVISYSGFSLSVNIISTAGTGMFDAWSIVGTSGPLQPPGYIEIEVADPHWFINYVSSYNLQDSNVGQFNLIVDQNTTGLPQSLNIKYKNDRQPSCCCIISNQYIIFDSFDATQDFSLQASKSLAYAWVMPPFNLNDGFVIPLDDQQYPMLLSEAKALAWFELKQMPHSKAEMEVNRQLASLQKFKALANKPSPFDYLPNFGRTPNTGGYAIFRSR
jgi:hypothetical protein